MRAVEIVTLFLLHDGEVLLLLRSPAVETLPGYWAGLSGRIEPGESPRAAARREAWEEAALLPAEFRFQRRGTVMRSSDPGRGILWCVHPLTAALCERRPLRLNWEHCAYRWIAPGELHRVHCVPGLQAALAAILKNRSRP
ncbi:MAG: NUDIX domain-containing protein [Candidatus Eisenbacteria bacterium]|nr:NUDIX domain-containing protein [Candidatus Eisenbacteria bacterium]